MKSGRVFWGAFFVILGLLGILNNFFGIGICWGTLWKLWPLLLVFLGISVFLKDTKLKWIIVASIGLLTGVVLFSSIQHGCDSVHRIVEHNFDDDDSSTTITQTLIESWSDPTATSVFRFEGGAGRFVMEDTTADYVSVDVNSSISAYLLRRERIEGRDHFYVGMEESSVKWEGGTAKNRVSMRLNPTPLWDVFVEAGAAKLKFDLTPYRIRTLSLEAGAADIEVRLGGRSDTTDVRVETGASSVKLLIPEEAACELRTESALSSKNFEGFDKVNSGLYRTSNFDQARQRISIRIESGLSSLSVKRIKGGEW
ncbi:MAG: hypothetical protein M5R41_11680 [Bacteroidia bacterium]|nr:hypothetical protein [Bacteroidia bacterium]